jgi:ribonuclease G
MRFHFEKTSAGHGRPRRDPRRHAGSDGDPSPAKSRKGRSRRKRGEPPAGFRVAEVYFERRGQRSIVGNIYKGKVDNVLPGLEAAFVDIGLDKNGFLHVDEIVLPGRRRRQARARQRAPGSPTAQAGQEIVVQVIKDPLKTKGARLSMELTIAGRYMVYAPTGEGVGVSRRLEDAERTRLRGEAKALDLGAGGAIIRTAAHGATRADFERELAYLFKLNEVLQKRVEEATAPALVFQEADLSVRVVRDIFSAHFERAIVDDPKAHRRLVSFFARTAPELVERVELWEEPVNLFEAYGRRPGDRGHDLAPRRPAQRRLPDDRLRRGADGHRRQHGLVHRQGQAGAPRGHDHQDQPRSRRRGREPAAPARHRRHHRHRLHRHGPGAQRTAVLETLRKALDEDRTKTFVVEISPLGLVEMTRQNVTDGVREIMTKACPTCDGEGVVKSEETIAIEIERKLRELAATGARTGRRRS